MEDEQILIEKLKGRDESAFTELVERYYGYLTPLANFFVANRTVAEEVVQETWLAVLNGIDRFEGRSSFKTWISRICQPHQDAEHRRISNELDDWGVGMSQQSPEGASRKHK